VTKVRWTLTHWTLIPRLLKTSLEKLKKLQNYKTISRTASWCTGKKKNKRSPLKLAAGGLSATGWVHDKRSLPTDPLAASHNRILACHAVPRVCMMMFNLAKVSTGAHMQWFWRIWTIYGISQLLWRIWIIYGMSQAGQLSGKTKPGKSCFVINNFF
jgi:hypothetical protein